MNRITLLCALLLSCLSLSAQNFSALTLNGTNGHVATPNTLTFGTNQNFSLEIRIKTTGWSGDPALLSDKDWNAGKNKGFVISGNTNGQTWKFNIGDGTNRIDLNNGGKINDNLWHNLTVTFDRTGAKRIYQDGRLLQTNNTVFTGDVTSPLANLGIGQDGTLTYSSNFGGSVAEVRVWNVALDSATVAAWTCRKVNNTHPNYASLLRYWAFPEGSGTTTTDAIANTLGTLSAGASWSNGAFETPVAAFSAVSAGLNADFTNNSTNTSLFNWQFGDGTSSTTAAPSHLYAQVGTYTVRLIAIGACENDTLQQTVTVGAGNTSDNLPGAGRALDFDGENDYVLIPSNDVFKPVDAITLEAWINVRSFDTEWETVLSFAQDNGGSESGYDLAFVNDKLRFRCKTTSMTTNEWDSNPGADVRYNEWIHIAGVYDGAEMRFYLNGVLEDAQPKTGAINWQFAPIDFRIGAYHDDNEDYYFDGQIDEVRVWNVARTEDELRQKMCSKLAGTESGLVGYWRFDEAAGNLANDRTANDLEGTLTNMAASSDRISSGAAIGEQSTYIYPADWTNASLSLPTPTIGTMKVSAVSGNPAGIQLYRVDSLPVSAIPANVVSLTGDFHWGIYPTHVGAQYTANFEYAGNAFINQFEPLIGYGVRNSGADAQWSALTGDLDGTNDILTRPGINGSRQLILATADFTAICPFQGVLAATNIGFSSIAVEWSAVQNLSTIQWGQAGFALGTGTIVPNITGSTYEAAGLESNTWYDFYVRDTCPVGQLPGIWFGPYSFRTSACVEPAALTVDQITTSEATLIWDNTAGTTYDLQWGPAGFTLGLGVQYPNVTSPYVLNGLANNKSYDLYLQSVCGGAGASGWFGPINFTTLLVSTNNIVDADAIKIYPNPTGQQFFLQGADIETLQCFNPAGQQVPVQLRRVDAQTIEVKTNAIPGLYFLEINTTQGIVLKKVRIGA